MSRYGPPQYQAAQVMKKIQGSIIPSIGTVRNYEQALILAANYMETLRLGSLQDITQDLAANFLNSLINKYSQKSIDMNRQALQLMMIHVTNELKKSDTLEITISKKIKNKYGRSYTIDQVRKIIAHQKPRNSFSTRLSYFSGIRAHELFTIGYLSEQPVDIRPTSPHKFGGRDNGDFYTVVGKGGLIRKICLSRVLAAKLESYRLDKPRIITDRKIHYLQRYDIGGGQNFSNSFSQTSKRTLGWSRGAHGLRHTYAQERMSELQVLKFLAYDEALITVSQEMGHFRADITKQYLR